MFMDGGVGQNEVCRMGRTWCPMMLDRMLMLSAEESFMEANEEFLAPTSLSGIKVCMMSGDSSGLFREELPRVAFTRNLEEKD